MPEEKSKLRAFIGRFARFSLWSIVVFIFLLIALQFFISLITFKNIPLTPAHIEEINFIKNFKNDVYFGLGYEDSYKIKSNDARDVLAEAEIVPVVLKLKQKIYGQYSYEDISYSVMSGKLSQNDDIFIVSSKTRTTFRVVFSKAKTLDRNKILNDLSDCEESKYGRIEDVTR